MRTEDWGLRIEVCEGWQLRCTVVYEVQSSYKSPQSGVFGVIGVYIWNHPILGCFLGVPATIRTLSIFWHIYFRFTYIKCIIPKSSKKRVSPLLCATLVPHLWHMWHKYKCATLLWHKFYKLHLFHFSTYRILPTISKYIDFT